MIPPQVILIPITDPSLTTHCLAFCAALTAHHQGEDAGMFAESGAKLPAYVGTKRPEDVAPVDWLRFEQEKHEKLLAVA